MHLAVYFYFGVALVGRQWVEGRDADGLDLYIPVFLIFEFLFYFGWLNVANNLYNPFGDDEEDFELIGLLERHVKVCMNIVEDDDDDIPSLEDANSKLGGINMNSKPDMEPNLGVGEEKAAGCIKIVLLSATPSEMPLSVAKNNPCLFKPEIEIQT